MRRLKTWRLLGIGLTTFALSMGTVLASSQVGQDTRIVLSGSTEANVAINFEGSTPSSEAGLFANFQDLYPGDTRSQIMNVANTSTRGANLSLVMRVAEDLTEAEKEFVYYLLYNADPEIKDILTVGIESVNVDSGSRTTLYGNALGGEGNTASYNDRLAGEVTTHVIPLGRLLAGNQVNLEVTLKVSPEMYNAYQGLMAKVNWLIEASWDDLPETTPPGGGDGDDDDEPTPTPTPTSTTTPTPSEEIPDEPVPGGPTEEGEEVTEEPIPGGPTEEEEVLEEVIDEEIPEEEIPGGPIPEQSQLPKTGDTFPVVPVATAGVIFAGVAAVTVLTSKKKTSK